jgi:LysR family transcriptional regulator, transcriptional activator of the cysJI operon
MEDFRLKVFYSVAKNQSFTKAASELFITQPAVTKHIKLLEESLKIRLFERHGNSIVMSTGGEILFRYASEIFKLYQEALFELGSMNNQHKGVFRLGASTTIAQYLISPILASFHENFPLVQLSLMNGNTELIEQNVLAKNIDLGIVEGKKHHTGLKYTDFMEDELVAVVHENSRLASKVLINLDDLSTVPLVLRERGSGTLEVIESALKDRGIRITSLPIIMHLGSTESIKSFLEHSNSMSFISIKAIEKEVSQGKLKIINIEGFRIFRKFSFVCLQGQQDGLSTTFMRFANRHYNKK